MYNKDYIKTEGTSPSLVNRRVEVVDKGSADPGNVRDRVDLVDGEELPADAMKLGDGYLTR